MDIWITIKVALRTLFRNKMRTFLTMLGMIFGVGCVVAMLSIGEGVRSKVMSDIESSGTNVISVHSWKINKEGRFESFSTLTVDDGEDIKKESQNVVYFSPDFSRSVKLVFGNSNWETRVYGVSEDYMNIKNLKLDGGRFFTRSEEKSSASVAVVGKKVVQELFDGEDPVDQMIRVKQSSFRVIGVLEAMGQGSWGEDMDDQIIIPHTTFQKKIAKQRRIWRLLLATAEREQSERARDEITDILRQRHRLNKEEEDDFTIRTMEDRIQQAQESNQVITILLGSIGSVSLLVGGIGIMNIMLVSVTERMREIGIRMAIGARQRDIMAQFLIESAIISLAGGLLGVGLGVLSAFLVGVFMKWNTVVTPQSVIVSFCFSGFVGIFFGLYPAWKASRLDPIKTLRRE